MMDTPKENKNKEVNEIEYSLHLELASPEPNNKQEL